MSTAFQERVNQLNDLYDQLMNSTLISATDATSSKLFPSKGGVYLLYEEEKPLYVGRTDNLKRRVRIHRTSDMGGATFAFKLAKEVAVLANLDLSDAKNKKEMAQHTEFKKLFIGSKERVGRMCVKHVLIEDAITQAIFEPYVHLQLNTPYNDFGNH